MNLGYLDRRDKAFLKRSPRTVDADFSVYLFQVLNLLLQGLILLHELVLRDDVDVEHLLEFTQLNLELTNHLELNL